jgi:hypothetical protein
MPGIPLKESGSYGRDIPSAPAPEYQKFFAPLFFKKAASSFHVLAID